MDDERRRKSIGGRFVATMVVTTADAFVGHGSCKFCCCFVFMLVKFAQVQDGQ
jgi:hypothetical protein